MRAALLGLVFTALAATAFAGESGGAISSDSRADVGRLPTGETPWWPSRYGADDQIGTLNEITPGQVLAAIGLVKAGTVVSLGPIIDENIPVFPGRYWHQTVDLSPHVTNPRRPDATEMGWGKNVINWITEIQAGAFQVGSQLNSIGHIQISDRFYNGWKVRDVVEPWGLGRFGMEGVLRIVTRGVLVDVAAYKSVDRLGKGYAITVADVQGALVKQGVAIGQGYMVLLCTGWGALWGRDNALFLSGEQGPGLALVEWLYEQRIAALGTDSWNIGPVPGEDPEQPFLVPQTMYVKMGLFGFENLANQGLAERRVYEFLFVNTHGRSRGSTAALMAPAAVF